MLKRLEYKDVKELYYIDEYGNIYSTYKNGFLKPTQDKDGYLKINLSGKGNKIYTRIATLVAYNFIGKPPQDIKDLTVDHIDGNILNNYYKNLRWLERSKNSSLKKERGKSLGELNPQAKLTKEQIIEICETIMQDKLTLQEIANKYKVSKSTINNIRRKQNWKNITTKYNFPKCTVKKDKRGKFYKEIIA